MEIVLLKSKIHRALVTGTEIGYVGSITLDADLMEAAGLWEHERVLVVDVENGGRFETYCIRGPAGSGEVCLNGAAARLVSRGDRVIVMAFAHLTPGEAAAHRPRVVFVDDRNRPVRTADGETPGETA
ncbi:MAG: aspartate 1-decarboxylase [Deltaproteobacteria bacterium]|jgi:aspartate 1-decarboxylase|nr:aspartate 1-decarboxylase [Deltaproteobacteria bacterium]MDR1296617.1 aspartate 1-decarboxylase [Deltaproteobacteria bacterium]